MKHLFYIFLFLFFSLNVQAGENYVMIGDTISIVSNNGKQEIKTKKTLVKKNKEYPIYIAENGRCYIKKKSIKTNKEYKSYLPETISRQIAKELGIEYIEKQEK